MVSGLEKQNPEALLEVEKENLRKQISEYNKGLAAHAGLCERLMSQVKRESKEIKEVGIINQKEIDKMEKMSLSEMFQNELREYKQ